MNYWNHAQWPLHIESLTKCPRVHDNVIQWKHFPVNWPLCRAFTGHRWIHRTIRPVTRSFDVLFDLHLNKRSSKQSWGLWLETPRSHYDATVLFRRHIQLNSLERKFLNFAFHSMLVYLQWCHWQYASISSDKVTRPQPYMTIYIKSLRLTWVSYTIEDHFDWLRSTKPTLKWEHGRVIAFTWN